MLKDLLVTMRVRDLLDILIVAFTMYKIFKLLRGTRAEQLIKGIVILFALTKLTEVFQIYTIHWMLTNIMTFGAVAIIIVFQPELRRGLEYLGRYRIFTKSIADIKKEYDLEIVDELLTATASLSRQKIGALMIIERKTGLKDIAQTGTEIGGKVSSELLISIFLPNTPLHDGAVIIKDGKIKSAGAFLPLTDLPNLDRSFGTRHRAAIGMSQDSDSLAIIVSEETGAISIAQNGEISKHIDIKTLESVLVDIYKPKSFDLKKINLWRNKDER